MGAVGTTQYMETNNGSIAIFNKATGALTSRESKPSFWTRVGLACGASGDQRVLFDHYSNRWIASGFGSTGNLINIAVSDTADASGTWKSTQIVGASLGVPGTLDSRPCRWTTRVCTSAPTTSIPASLAPACS